MKRRVPPPRMRVDYETYSDADIKKVGAWKYAEHESTKLLVATYEIDGEYIMWVPDGRVNKKPARVTQYFDGPEVPRCILKELKHGRRFAANNAEFEYAITTRTIQHELPLSQIECIAGMQSYFHLPRNLDEGSRLLGLPGKPANAQEIIDRFTRPAPQKFSGKGRNAIGQSSIFDQEVVSFELDELCEYNVMDVFNSVGVDTKLAPHFPESEVGIYQRTLGMNERGLPIDFEFLNSFRHIQDKAPTYLEYEGRQYTYDTLASINQFKDLLAEVGWPVASLNKHDIENALNSPRTPDIVKFLLAARRDAARVSLGKVEVIVNYACEDDVLRGAYIYGGTDTMRWASWGAQVQNLPKPDKGIKSKACVEAITKRDIAEVIKAGGGYHNRALVASLSGLIYAGKGHLFTKSDFAQIEARFVLWLADDIEHLEWWRQGRDMYSEMATRLFCRPILKGRDDTERDVGKRLVLACNFQLGADKFENVEAPKYGIDLKKLGITGQDAVGAFRKEFRSLSDPKRGLWVRLQNACIDCIVTGRTIHEAHLIFRRVGRHLFVELPSGRDHIFREARVESIEKKNDNTGETWTVTVMTSVNANGDKEEFYGGKLADIFTQASCRDLQADAWRRAEEAGLDLRMQTHDELVIRSKIENAEAEKVLLEKIMTESPPWCPTFPIGVDSKTTERYLK